MKFIVKLNNSNVDLTAKYQLSVLSTYPNLPEFILIDTDLETAERLRVDPDVAYVKINKDKEFKINLSPQATTGTAKKLSTDTVKVQSATLGFQRTNYQWHLNYLMRKAHKNTVESSSGVYSFTRTGDNVDVYIMDTGIFNTHLDFQNRTTGAYDRVLAIPGWISPAGNHLQDGAGHGTHVAGLVGGWYSGVAKLCRLYSVRVFDNLGASIDTAGMLGAFNAVIAHHNSKGGSRPSVLNMSLGDMPSSGYPYVYFNDPNSVTDDYLDDMVDACANAGITVVISAGNGFDNGDETNYVFHGRMNSRFIRPARTENVITVGALNPDSSIAYYSNYGQNVDVFAPGSDIYSALNTDASMITVMSGTSMAAPIVSGMCALYLQGDPTASPMKVRSNIISKCSKDGQVYDLDTAPLTDGVQASGTTLYYYNSSYQVIGEVPYPTTELTADRVLYSPYKASNEVENSLTISSGKYQRV